MKATNKFHRGVNADASLYEIANDELRKAVNMELMVNGSHADLINMRSTEQLATIVDSVGSDFTILGRVATWARVDANCTGTYSDTRGLLYFTYDSNNGSQIRFYDIEGGAFYTVYPDPTDTEDTLGFSASDHIDALAYSDRNKHLVYFTDGRNELRKVELKLGGTGCASYPHIDLLSVRRKAPVDCLSYTTISNNGGLLPGTYYAAYRYYNSETCDFSNWSNIVGPVPVILDDDACSVPGARGGKAGQVTNKAIQFTIDTDLGETAYDNVQLLIIKANDASQGLPNIGYLLPPSTDFYSTNTYTYTGSDKETEIDLADVLIDDLALIAANTISIKDERMFAGGMTLQGFEADNGDPAAIDKAYAITTQVGDLSNDVEPYACEDDTVNKKGYFRGEVYPFGLYYYDEFGNGVVFPIDLSSFDEDSIIEEDYANGAVISARQVTSTVDLEAGDRIQIGGEQANVLTFAGGTATVDTDLTVGNVGAIDLLAGQRGNQGTGWAFKFGERSNNQLTIFDENGEVNALGLRLAGIKNHPTWSKGFMVVRRKRIKDILYQTPHIPTIAVQGVGTVGVPLTLAQDYDGQLDTMCPKIHRMGTARNIVRKRRVVVTNGQVEYAYEYSEYEGQLATGLKEVSPVWFILSPEYLYGIEGDSVALEDIDGAKGVVVDAVAYRFDRKLQELMDNPQNLDYPGNNQNKFASVFAADERGYYFYNREGQHVIDGNIEYQLGIYDLEPIQNIGMAEEFDIGWHKNLVQNAPFTGTEGTVWGAPQFTKIDTYGQVGELALQQFVSNIVEARYSDLFYGIVKNQRGVIAKVNDVLHDWSYIFTVRKANQNDNYYPLLGNWNVREGIFNDDVLVAESRPLDLSLDDPPVNYDPITGSFVNYVPDLGNGDIAGGAFIINVKRGLGDNRYGSINTSGEWMCTNICQPLTSDDIANKTSFDVDVYGGDCFITKHSLKVHDSAPRITMFDPLNSETEESGFESNTWTKTGAYEKHVEILDIYLESIVNANYAHIVDRYPAVDESSPFERSMKDYGNDWDYYYLPAYSFENELKVKVAKEEYCDNLDLWSKSFAWSDRRVRGGVTTPFNEIDGFTRFRVNNLVTMDGQFGDVIKLDTLEDKAMHVFQERKVAFIPIGVDELRTQDNVLIATGTGNVLGSGEYYVPKDFGLQHPGSLAQRDGAFYWIDQNRRSVIRMGTRGSAFKVISWDRYQDEIESYLDGTFGRNSLRGHIDPENERYIIHNIDNNEAHIYNLKGEMWGGSIEDKQISSGIGDDYGLYWTNENVLYKAYSGDTHGYLFDGFVESEFWIVFNEEDQINKVLQSLELNADNLVDDVLIEVFDSSSGHPFQVSPRTELVRDPKRMRYVQNVLRSAPKGTTGKGIKLRGRAMVLKFRIDNNGRKVLINSLITNYRRSV